MNQESLYLWAGLQECERILFKKEKEKKKGKGKREGKGKKRCLRTAGVDNEGFLEDTRFELAQRSGTTYSNTMLIMLALEALKSFQVKGGREERREREMEKT